MEVEKELIVLYDGSCGVCSRTVQFVLEHGDERIKFAPLGSEISDKIFLKNGQENPDMETFYFSEFGVLHERSRGAFYLAGYLSPRYKWLSVFKYFPKWMTDPFYNLVARNRKKIAGENCLVPTAEERKRFIELNSEQ